MEPTSNQIDVWCINVSRFWQNSTYEYALSKLSKSERLRATNIKVLSKKEQYIAAKVSLRRVLSQYINNDVNPVDLNFNILAKGKPCLSGKYSNIKFNLSHSSKLVAISVALGIENGIDIEFINKKRDLHKLAEACFTKIELDEFYSIKDSHKSAFFYQLWTKKEALLKAIGCGLTVPLDALSVKQGELYCNTSGNKYCDQLTAKSWGVESVAIDEQYCLSVAFEKSERAPNIKLHPIASN